MSDDWHKDTPEPRHWLFYVLVEIGVPRVLAPRAASICASERRCICRNDAARRSAQRYAPAEHRRMPARRRQVNAYEQGTALPVRHDAARRRADDGRRFLARGQAADRRRRSTSSASTTSRAAIPAPTSPTRSSSARPRSSSRRTLHRLRHDQARRPLGLQRSGLPGVAAGRVPTPSASSPRRGTITCAWRSASPTRRTSRLTQSVEAVVETRPRGA